MMPPQNLYPETKAVSRNQVAFCISDEGAKDLKHCDKKNSCHISKDYNHLSAQVPFCTFIMKSLDKLSLTTKLVCQLLVLSLFPPLSSQNLEKAHACPILDESSLLVHPDKMESVVSPRARMIDCYDIDTGVSSDLHHGEKHSVKVAVKEAFGMHTSIP